VNGDTNNPRRDHLATDATGSPRWAATVVVGGTSGDGD